MCTEGRNEPLDAASRFIEANIKAILERGRGLRSGGEGAAESIIRSLSDTARMTAESSPAAGGARLGIGAILGQTPPAPERSSAIRTVIGRHYARALIPTQHSASQGFP